MAALQLKMATKEDVATILYFIRQLAIYEKMIDQVIASEESLRKWLFEEKKAEVVLGEIEGKVIGFALFFHNFSTFLGKAGLYLEDLYIEPSYRHQGYGRMFFTYLANLALQRHCGRFEWACLDWNQPSIDFYKGLGAIPLNEWTIYRLDEAKMKALVGCKD